MNASCRAWPVCLQMRDASSQSALHKNIVWFFAAEAQM